MKYRVLYADTDAMGVMYYANYLRIYEAGRSDFMRKLGFSFSEAEAQGIACPAINVNIDYISFVKFDEEIIVKTSVEEIPKVKFVFHQKIYDKNGNLLNSAVVTLGFISTENYRARRCPKWLLEYF